MHFIKSLFPQSLKNLYHLAQAIAANVIFGFPSRKLRVIGVTGTDGKTTTVQMIAEILQETGNPIKSGDHVARKVAMASTINFRINGVEEKNLSHFTTESAFALQRFIKKAVKAGCEYLVLETSSHSLDQHRVWGVAFDVAVITNVTREHLDYHKTMEKYREAKGKLFAMVAKQTKVISHKSSVIIVNADMDDPKEFLNFNVDKKIAYSTKETRLPLTDDRLQYVYAKDVELGINFSKFKVQNSLAGQAQFTLNLPGIFNVENALAAVCVALGEGIDLEQASYALSKIKGVPGRMEAIENEIGVNILVDFALTPNALERLYKLLSEIKKPTAKIIAVFGSCGDRDKGKRPIMGEIVAKQADIVILTNDEPYHEKPQTIIDEIKAGIKNKTEEENLFAIIDRREAINKALQLANPDDIVCVTGMGNFESMVVGDKKIPWNDRQVIEEELKVLQDTRNKKQ
ncbi:MAG: UDP-N-acetylmuramoyl-L-alanyl-D-glutamate--2,6-diaminopimelate ligase [Candidatus Moranbacteria bacterium]|nr:UDP-N-acetylmuramoyl-L-alanyl-D-glutamate--2,6-diaminopimelate ligase [Candidatus Moranbacteria bacterium]